MLKDLSAHATKGRAFALAIAGFGILAACAAISSPEKQTPAQLACTSLAAKLKSPDFPVPDSRITLAQLNVAASGAGRNATLPDHCEIQGVAGEFTGADGVRYGAGFELRMPLDWNGRFMFQGGGGTEGSVPPAVGVAGTLTPTLAKGWAVVSQNGGHDNALLAKAGHSPLEFLLEPRALAEHASGSIDKTTRVARYLIHSYYGRPPERSYHVGCSTGGRQGMVFSQQFPEYFDGIIAGDPVYDLTALTQGEVNSLQAIAARFPGTPRAMRISAVVFNG